ncbi:unnamed protein product [Nippostrongylus brasiliensis]|uniref:AT04676p (inferred by orthology to a D. melanogaster protein) n=1 Tax=Nippostrongylus brasiliensis TaxID=27835 RepID=A0A0N4XUV0_NIPBR|nr:unnamed protein product [Nippostrongylus brasiliensis]
MLAKGQCWTMPNDGGYKLTRDNDEKTAVLDSLRQRATLVKEAYGSIEGIKCNEVQGAMYAFPRLELPPRAIEKARSLGQEPDFFYAMQLLESSGVCIVPGSGFGQKKGTYHFRPVPRYYLPDMPLEYCIL